MIPYGYKIENGQAILDPEAASKVKDFFQFYLEGLPVSPACLAARVDRAPHSSWKILEDRRYLGDDFYPPLIDRDTFEAVQRERALRNHNPPDQVHYEVLPGVVPTTFKMKHVAFLPQNAALIPQLLYDCIQSYQGELPPMEADERERLLYHISFALETLPDAPITVDQTPTPSDLRHPAVPAAIPP